MEAGENIDEYNYLEQVRKILEDGIPRSDRTGIGTLSIFGVQTRYSLRFGKIPLLTTKRVFWRGIVEELLWFIRGETDSKTLSARGVKIWDANGSRQFLNSRGFTDREEGNLGPVYGFQWRHFGAEYQGPNADYTGQGVDQISKILDQIRNDPDSRRIILCSWNPMDLPKMTLPPCHVLCQFYVRRYDDPKSGAVKNGGEGTRTADSSLLSSPGDVDLMHADEDDAEPISVCINAQQQCRRTWGELSCQLYQRSGDMGLGVPFNIASYSLLTHMIAKVTGLDACEFVHTLGDAHIYKNHIGPLKLQMKRRTRPFPTVRFVGGEFHSLDDFRPENIMLEGYDPWPALKMEMAL